VSADSSPEIDKLHINTQFSTCIPARILREEGIYKKEHIFTGMLIWTRRKRAKRYRKKGQDRLVEGL
jgi:hypothetical protein